MLTIEECRKLLPKKDRKKSDEEIRKVRDHIEQWAELIFDVWLEERKDKKTIKKRKK